MMPTTSRIVPTVAISMPETVAVTANRSIAPSAIRKMDVPIPIGFPLSKIGYMSEVPPMTGGQTPQPGPCEPVRSSDELTFGCNSDALPCPSCGAADLCVGAQHPAVDHPGRRPGDRLRRRRPERDARRDARPRRRRGQDLGLVAGARAGRQAVQSGRPELLPG